jgi:hypothetical protein
MNSSFRHFLNTYLDAWRNSSLTKMQVLISDYYKAREISGGDVIDFGLEESIKGWEQGFNFVRENNAQWVLNELSVLPLRNDEILAIISATMVIQGKSLETANLFFQTFKKNRNDEWKLVRSYIEAGIPIDNLNDTILN